MGSSSGTASSRCSSSSRSAGAACSRTRASAPGSTLARARRRRDRALLLVLRRDHRRLLPRHEPDPAAVAGIAMSERRVRRRRSPPSFVARDRPSGTALDVRPRAGVVPRRAIASSRRDFHAHTRFTDGFLSPFDLVAPGAPPRPRRARDHRAQLTFPGKHRPLVLARHRRARRSSSARRSPPTATTSSASASPSASTPAIRSAHDRRRSTRRAASRSRRTRSKAYARALRRPRSTTSTAPR